MKEDPCESCKHQTFSSQQQQEEIKADEPELREVVPVTSMAVEGFGKQRLLCCKRQLAGEG